MTSTESDIYIADGNITIFLGLHSNTFKEDILHSSLLGSLVSNSSSIASEDWMRSYTKILGSIFWITKSQRTQTPEISSASIYNLAKLTLSSYLSAVQLKKIEECFNSIKKLPTDSTAILALSNRFHLANENNDTSTICPLLTIICENKTIISFNTLFTIPGPFDLAILDEEVLLETTGNATQTTQWITHLEEDNYAAIRDTVIEKLGSKIKTNLFHIET